MAGEGRGEGPRGPLPGPSGRAWGRWRQGANLGSAGTLSFNDELLGLDRELGDYVIVHELLHFAVPNHGPLWKSLMRAHLGEWESLAARLNAH